MASEEGKRIAIVVQRYGEEVNGGAELHARWLAERLQAGTADHSSHTSHAVTILTTCALDYLSWENHFPAGRTTINGVSVERYPVDAPRHWKKAQKSTRHLLLNDHTLMDELAWIQAQGPLSSPLLQAIEDGYARFDFYIFFTYLYAPTYFGLPLVADKAILIPTAHDDPFLTFPLFRPTFHLPRAIAYNTVAERDLVNVATRNTHVEHIIAGIGINTPKQVDPARFRAKYGVDGDFLLYVGRIDASKNVEELFEQFVAFRAGWDRPLKLLLGGKSHLDIPDHPDIVPLGFISEQDKFDGMAAASALMMPSLFESLSMVTLEAWLMETPTLVNGNCALLKAQTRLSNGGLYYHNETEFRETLILLLSQPQLGKQMGANGRAFVQAMYSWDVILEKYDRLFCKLSNHN